MPKRGGRTCLIRSISFRASHRYQLAGLSPIENRAMFGEVAESHWHDWKVTVWVTAQVDPETGMLCDLPSLDRILQEHILIPFADKDFSQGDPFFFDHPATTERLAGYFFERLTSHIEGELIRVRVSEDDSLAAEYEK